MHDITCPRMANHAKLHSLSLVLPVSPRYMRFYFLPLVFSLFLYFLNSPGNFAWQLTPQAPRPCCVAVLRLSRLAFFVGYSFR